MDAATLAYGRNTRGIATCALVVLCLTGCASFTAPVSHSDGRSDAEQPSQTRPSALELQPVEGRPGGLVLRLRAENETFPGGRLEVRRRVGDDDAETIRTVELSRKLARQLADPGIEFIDRSVESGPPTRYQLLYFESPDRNHPEARSDVLSIDWKKPPPRPSGVRAYVDTPRLVELQWKPAEFGALVFRRNVLDESASTRRIAAVGPSMRGTLVDRDIEPGVVYTYRVALSVEHDNYTQYGPPSEPLYVSVPARNRPDR